MRGFSGEWLYYGNQEGTVRICEASGSLEDEANGTSYVLRKDEGADVYYATNRESPQTGELRKVLRVHDNVLLFLGDRNPILLRKGIRFKAPREKIRGRWHYAVQLNEVFYYDAEFDLDARKMVEISSAMHEGHVRSEARSLELLLDAQAELALQGDDVVYHFARLGAEFLVLEGSYPASIRNGYKILMQRVQAPNAGAASEAKQQADGQRKATKRTKKAHSQKTK